MEVNRAKGLLLYRPIVYGNLSVPFKSDPPSDFTHTWTAYVRGVNDEDISYYVDRVEFKLHESFEQPIRIVSKFPFEVTEKGWGEFEIHIKIFLVDPNEKPIHLTHFLRLYPIEDLATVQHPIENQTVITEHYDEILFQDPSSKIQQALSDGHMEAISLKNFSSQSAYGQTELQELSKLDGIKGKLEAALDRLKKKQIDYEKKLQKLE